MARVTGFSELEREMAAEWNDGKSDVIAKKTTDVNLVEDSFNVLLELCSKRIAYFTCKCFGAREDELAAATSEFKRLL